jgi:hypothetical protein
MSISDVVSTAAVKTWRIGVDGTPLTWATVQAVPMNASTISWGHIIVEIVDGKDGPPPFGVRT